jgi:hypothetical protein
VVDVVVLFGDGARTMPRLEVRQPCLERLEGGPGAYQRMLLCAGGKHPPEELIERLAVPVAVEIGFADAERTAQRAAIEPVAVDLDIPGTVAADPDARPGDQGFEQRLEESVRHCGRRHFTPMRA